MDKLRTAFGRQQPFSQRPRTAIPYITPILPSPPTSANLLTVAANSATGFRSPKCSSGAQRLHTHCRRFFSPAMSIYGGCAWGTFGCAGCLTVRSANPRTAATFFRFAAEGGGSTEPSGVASWSSRPPIHPLSISPPITRCFIFPRTFLKPTAMYWPSVSGVSVR